MPSSSSAAPDPDAEAPDDLDAPDWEREKRRLKLFVEWAEGFEFAIAAYSRLDSMEKLVGELTEDLAEAGIAVRRVDLRGTDRNIVLLKLLMATLKEAEASGEAVDAIFLTGLEAHLDYKFGGARPEETPLLANANFQRDAFPPRCPVPLVLWTPALGLPAVARQAPDLWHWRRAGFEFLEADRPWQESFDRAIPRPERGFDRLPVEDLKRRLGMLTELLEEQERESEAPSPEDTAWRARLTLEKAETLWDLGEVQEAKAVFERGLALARDSEAEQLVLRAWDGLAKIHERTGNPDEALRIRREEELPVYERLGDTRNYAVTIGNIADILQARGEVDEALRIRREEELPVYERLSDTRNYAVTMGRIADILQDRGEVDEALRIRREEELPVYERLGDVHQRAVTMGKIADILQDRGEVDEALRIRREEQLPVYERLGDVRARAVTIGNIADILQARGEVDEALRIRREEELPVYERVGDVRGRSVALFEIGSALLDSGGLEDGRGAEIYEALKESYEIARRLGLPDGIGHVGLRLAQVLAALGRRGEALSVLDEAEGGFRKLGSDKDIQAVQRLRDEITGEGER